MHNQQVPDKRKAAGGNHAAIHKKHEKSTTQRMDFQAVNRVAVTQLSALLMHWLPHGKQLGSEWVACNPRRADRNAGSFKINMHTGRWADFATGDGGGDVISLAAYLGGLSQKEAAHELAKMLGMGV